MSLTEKITILGSTIIAGNYAVKSIKNTYDFYQQSIKHTDPAFYNESFNWSLGLSASLIILTGVGGYILYKKVKDDYRDFKEINNNSKDI